MRLRKSSANVVPRRRQPNANLVWVGIAAWGIAEAISLLLSIWRSIVAQRAAISRRKNLSATAGQTGCRWPSFTGRFNGKQTNLVHGTNLGS